DERLQIRARQSSRLQLLDGGADGFIELQNLPAAPLALFQRLRHRLVEELVDAPEDRLVRAAAQPRPVFVAHAERQERRLLELERVALLRVVGHLGERARHADRLERLLAQVVRLLGVERENLEGDLRIGHDERGDRADAELLQRLQTMVAVWRQVLAVVADGDDRIEEAADRLDDAHQPLDVRIRDRKSTRLNSSHVKISYAVFCLKKK